MGKGKNKWKGKGGKERKRKKKRKFKREGKHLIQMITHCLNYSPRPQPKSANANSEHEVVIRRIMLEVVQSPQKVLAVEGEL